MLLTAAGVDLRVGMEDSPFVWRDMANLAMSMNGCEPLQRVCNLHPLDGSESNHVSGSIPGL